MEEVSGETWNFGRYSVVTEYEGRTTIPPPFSFLQNLVRIVRFIRRGLASDPTAPDLHLDFMLKRIPHPSEMALLRDFEVTCCDALIHDQQMKADHERQKKDLPYFYRQLNGQGQTKKDGTEEDMGIFVHPSVSARDPFEQLIAQQQLIAGQMSRLTEYVLHRSSSNGTSNREKSASTQASNLPSNSSSQRTDSANGT